MATHNVYHKKYFIFLRLLCFIGLFTISTEVFSHAEGKIAAKSSPFEGNLIAPPNPCDPNISGNPDTDGDGIADVCDEDDDNDGILDSDENCTIFNSTEETGVTFSQPSGSGPYSRFRDGGLWLSVFDGAYSVRASKTIDEALAGDEITVNFNGYQKRNGGAGPANAPGTVTIEVGGIVLYDDTYNNYVATYGTNLGRSSFTFNTPVDAPVLQITYVRPTGSGFDILSGHFDYQLACDTDNDGIPNKEDLDSDNDGCSDANEAYADANADGSDGGAYGTGSPPTNPDGTVVAAAYSTPFDADGNGTFDFLEVGAVPVISVQPNNQVVYLPGNGWFKVTATNVDAYQWQLSMDEGVSFSDINDGPEYTGTQTDSLTVLAPKLDKRGYLYRVLLTNATHVCPTVSEAARLLVGPRTVITNRRITVRVKNN